MRTYEEKVIKELLLWQKKMLKKPSIFEKLTKKVQGKFNQIIPEKVHGILTTTIKNMVYAVLTGSEFITRQINYQDISLEKKEELILEKINFYKKAAAAGGVGTGAGGLLIGLADLPILLSLKFKFLFDTACIYGFNVKDLRERLYILYLFQLAFSSQTKRNEVFKHILNYEKIKDSLPESMENYDWRSFQQEYRDYIDLAKMMQLIPGIGAVVGAYTNYQLMDKLGKTAMNGYRLRLYKEGKL